MDPTTNPQVTVPAPSQDQPQNVAATNPGASSATPEPSQSGSSAPATTPTIEELQAQVAEQSKIISKLTANNEKAVNEKLEEKRKRREATDSAELVPELKEENLSLTEENLRLKRELESYKEQDRSAFKAKLTTLPPELRDRFSDPERFTIADLDAVLSALAETTAVPVPSDAKKPPKTEGVGSIAGIEAAAATGNPEAINKAFDAYLSQGKK